MRKKVFGKKLNRNRRSRTALFRSLMKAMILRGTIQTTKAKGIAVRGELDGLLGFARDGSITARRQALSVLGNDRMVTDALFEKYKALADSRFSGFTRLELAPNRKGDNAEMVKISWVEIKEEKKK